MKRKVDKATKEICDQIRNGEIVPVEERLEFMVKLFPNRDEREYAWRWLEHTL